MFAARRRRKRLKSMVMDLVLSDPDLKRRHAEKKWTRRWTRFGFWVTVAFSVVGSLMIGATAVVIGAMLMGTVQVGRLVGGGLRFEPPMAPFLASWSILCLGAMLSFAFKIRSTPISALYRPWGSHLPIEDRKLISPVFGGLLPIAGSLGLVAIGGFVPAGLLLDWDIGQFARVLLMIALTIVSTWLIAEWLAAVLAPTPLIQSTSFTIISLIFISGLALTVVPHDLLEIRQPESYAPIWRLPPAGWFVGISGVIPSPAVSTWWMPIIGILVTLYAGIRFMRTLELEDIQITTAQKHPAFRKGWLRKWTRPRSDSIMARYVDKPERLAKHVAEHRESLLRSSRPWWRRLLFPFQPSSRQLAILGLLGIRFPRRGQFVELSWGIWPILCAIGLLVFNQYYPLVALPRFLRVPLIFSFALSLVDFREFAASLEKGSSSLGASSSRSLFPMRTIEIFRALFWNRLLFLWTILPGWLIAVAILLLTDIPIAMIVNPPLIVAVCSLVFPVYSTVLYCSNNARSGWQSTLVILPFTILSTAAILALQFGVCGYLFAMRPDLSWLWLLGTCLLLLAGTGCYFYGRKRWKIDDSSVMTARFGKGI